MAGVNPNSPWARHYVDLPTDVAIKMELAAKAAGKSKKQFIADAILAACGDKSSSKKK